MSAKNSPFKAPVWQLVLKILLGLYIVLVYLAFTFKWIPLIHPLSALQLHPLPLQDTPPLNLIPFRSIARYWQGLQSSDLRQASLLNLGGNLLVFLPIGLLLPLSLSGNLPYLRSLLTGFLLTLSIELTQLLLAIGVWDIDDIFLNMLGLGLGLLCSVPLSFLINRKARRRRVSK